MKRAQKPRECGECSLCCTVLEVDGMNKGPKRHCMHEKEGGGCHIYEDRPNSCREFACAWLAQPEIVPNWARPPRSGLILVGYAAGPSLVVYEAREGAFVQNLTKLGSLMSETGWPTGYIVFLDPFRGIRRIVGGPRARIAAFMASAEGQKLSVPEVIWSR